MSRTRIGKKHPNLLQTMDNPEGYQIKTDAHKVRIRIDHRTEVLVVPEKVEATKKKYGLT